MPTPARVKQHGRRSRRPCTHELAHAERRSPALPRRGARQRVVREPASRHTARAVQLHLVRHAIAADAATDRPDASRPLTDKGADKFAAEVRGAKRLGWRYDRVYHSPLLRAVQTAELLRPLVGGGSLHVLPDLARAPDVELLAHIEGERVALVGHEPYLSALLAWLLTGELEGGERFAFKKGGVAIVEGALKPGAMTLLAMIPPKLLRELGD
jgi:phosphohistidine phosphatase